MVTSLRVSLCSLLLVLSGALLFGPRGTARAGGDEADEPASAAGPQRLPPDVPVSLSDAVKTAEANVGGRAFRSRLEAEKEGPVYEVLVLVPGPKAKLVEVTVDAKTGKVLPTEAGTAGEDGEGGENGEEGGGEEHPAGAPPADAEGPADAARFTEDFAIDPADLAAEGRSRYFVLEPGYTLTLEKRGTHVGRLVIRVLDETQVVAGVTTRVVEERETLDGKEVEVSRNLYAISRRTSDVYCFGEDTGGAWQAGQGGARPGLVMPGTPLLGARYAMELAPGQAMDRGRILSVGESFDTPAGSFPGCVRVEETTPLEPGTSEYTIYAPGIGVVYDDGFTLVDHRTH